MHPASDILWLHPSLPHRCVYGAHTLQSLGDYLWTRIAFLSNNFKNVIHNIVWKGLSLFETYIKFNQSWKSCVTSITLITILYLLVGSTWAGVCRQIVAAHICTAIFCCSAHLCPWALQWDTLPCWSTCSSRVGGSAVANHYTCANRQLFDSDLH